MSLITVFSESALKQLLLSMTLYFLLSLEPLYRTELSEASREITIALQNGTGNTYTYFISKLISDLGGEVLIAGTIIVAFIWFSRARAFYYIVLMILVNSLTSIGKIYYHQPRPYMIYDSVHVNGSCSTDYGHPSGHALTSMAVSVAVMFDYYASYPSDELWKKILAGICIPWVPILVGLSRLYNGVHSLDQVFLGWALGVWTACLAHFILRDFILEHIDTLLYKNNTVLKSSDYSAFIVLATCIFSVLISSLIAVYQYTDYTFTVPTAWKNRIYSKCNKIVTGDNFQGDSLVTGGFMGLFLGSYFGVVY